MFTDTQREEILNKVAKILVEHGTVCASDAITDGCPVNGNIRGYIKSLVRDLVDDAFVETLGIMKEKVNVYPLSLKINISMG